MEIQRAGKQKKATVFASELAFTIVLFLAWTRYTLVNFGLIFVQRIPLIGSPIANIYPLIFIAFVLLAFPWIVKKVRVTELLIYLLVVAAIALTVVFHPQNITVIGEQLGRILVVSVPMMFIGVCYDHERHKKLLFLASLLAMLVMFVYQNYQMASGQTLMEDNMDAAYKVLPSVMYLLYYAYTDKSKPLWYWLVAVFGAGTLFIYGTRGPILCVVVFIAIISLLNLKKMQTSWKKLLSVVVIAAVLVLVFSGDTMTNVAQFLSTQFGKRGFSTRIFDAYIEGEMIDDSGRTRLIALSLTAIGENPFFGYGLLGDRVLLGTYPHHVFLELWIQFGVLFGTIAIVAVMILPIKALYKQRQDHEALVFLLMLICTTFVKLLLSSSYLVEWPFFFMIGICLAMIRKSTAVEGGIRS
ncbi:MAG: O-antigen ligase family protein [Clostridia bacterium]|nr:O-antigen ligase family protein [Clostridia bacterium]